MEQNKNEKIHPRLIGHGVDDVTAELNSIEETARFIMEQGQRGDVRITYDDGRPFLDTFGFYINRIADMQYREKLLEILIPMQHEIEMKAFGQALDLPPPPDDTLRLLTQEEIDVICANHVLWLHDAGGQQADFSGCMLKGAKLLHRNLMNAVFTGARLSACDLRDSEINFSNFSDAYIDACNMDGVMGDEANFSNAALIETSMKHSFMTHADFTDAQFRKCMLDTARLQNCCFDGTEFEQTDTELAYLTNPSYDQSEWSQDEQPAMS